MEILRKLGNEFSVSDIIYLIFCLLSCVIVAFNGWEFIISSVTGILR
ncbi:hypothetical protein FM038_25275 [Shewanella eurypsychrophilus]|uniref:Uncharacterized protein n=1 Tax=Shewanella eurypsychrophilus TaxID=2593656 RepID=A0ABX8S321_9GAMM|nr:hypothetical protein [Shewanella eurypsychrophilus]QXP44962.1 hypothetical protein FM038_25275 [Shewanella eurypsychrophilus]